MQINPYLNFDGRTEEALAGQRKYLQGMIDAVRAGIKRGATADKLAETISFEGYAEWGADKTRNATAVKAVYAKLKK